MSKLTKRTAPEKRTTAGATGTAERKSLIIQVKELEAENVTLQGKLERARKMAKASKTKMKTKLAELAELKGSLEAQRADVKRFGEEVATWKHECEKLEAVNAKLMMIAQRGDEVPSSQMKKSLIPDSLALLLDQGLLSFAEN